MLKHLMKFENWSDEIIPREIQLDIIDIMNDLKDDIDCRVSYQWWPPYAKYDPQYKAGDKYPYIQITNIRYKSLENYLIRVKEYLNTQGFSIIVRYDSSKSSINRIEWMNALQISGQTRRYNSRWKILKNKIIIYPTDFRIELINRSLKNE